MPVRAALRPAARGVKDATILLTGGAGGIGAACARALLAAGATVVLCDRDAERLARVAEELAAIGDVDPYVLDVTSADAVQSVVTDIRRNHRRIDVLVNNAGVMDAEPLLDHSLETWRRVFAVNVEGALLMSQAVAPLMTDQSERPDWARRGLLVNVSSRSAEVGRPFSAAYGASKAALNHLTTSLSATLNPSQVACAVIYPGDVKEGMLGATLPALAAAQGRDVQELNAERVFQAPEEYAAILRDLIATPGMVLDGHVVRPDRTVTALEAARPKY